MPNRSRNSQLAMYPLKTLAGGARHQLSHYVKIILVCLEGMAYNFISFSRMNDAPLERGITSRYELRVSYIKTHPTTTNDVGMY